jgi:hypothetical protein
MKDLISYVPLTITQANNPYKGGHCTARISKHYISNIGHALTLGIHNYHASASTMMIECACFLSNISGA